MKKLLKYLLGGCALALAAGQVAVAAGVPEPLISLPLEREGRGTLKVLSQSKDGVPLRVVFDSAASNSILFEHAGTADVAREVGGTYPVYFPFTGRILDFKTMGLFTLRFGVHSFTSNSWVTGSWKDTGLFPGRAEPNYDVIAGRDVFNNFALAVDPARGQAALFIAGQDLSARYEASVPITDLEPLIAVRVRTTRLDTGEIANKLMLVDTGFAGVLLFADDDELAALQADEETPLKETLKAPIYVDTVMQIDGMAPEAQRARIVSRGVFEGADGVVGTSFLNNYRYAFDLTVKKLYLAKSR